MENSALVLYIVDHNLSISNAFSKGKVLEFVDFTISKGIAFEYKSKQSKSHFLPLKSLQTLFRYTKGIFCL